MYKAKVIHCKDKSFTNQSTGEHIPYFDIGLMAGDLVGFVGSKAALTVGSDVNFVLGTNRDYKFFVTLEKQA